MKVLPFVSTIVGLVLAILAGLAMPAAAQDTLAGIRERGFLVCAAPAPLAGFSQSDAEGRWTGFDIDICRAIAAAALGDPNLLEFRPLRGTARFAQLQNGEVDVLVRNAPWTQRRDTQYGVQYVTPTFYDGQAFMVPNSLGIVSAFELVDVVVCVVDEDEAITRLREFFFSSQVGYSTVVYEDRADLGIAYRSGRCNAVSGAGRDLHAIRRELPDPAAHRILPERVSSEALGPVVRAGDQNWFDLVRWTVFTLLNAEEQGVNALNIEQLSATRTPAIRRLLGLESDFGRNLGVSATFMVDVIRAVGNYGDLYERNFGAQTGTVLLRGHNALWINGGLHYAPPVR